VLVLSFGLVSLLARAELGRLFVAGGPQPSLSRSSRSSAVAALAKFQLEAELVNQPWVCRGLPARAR
jgi:hypothetical protein